MWRNSFLAAALLLGGSCTLLAGDTPVDRATLRGIKALRVVIDPLQEQLKADDVSAEGLQEQIEQRLREAGIQIDPEANSFLGLRIISSNTGRGRKAPWALAVWLGFYQLVTLTRDNTIKGVAPTWSQDAMVAAQPRYLGEVAKGSVAQLADVFVNAYRSVNPQ